jgi:integrase
MNLTKTTVERLPIPDKGYQIHWDEKLAGFGVRVTPGGAKSFVFQKRINGKEKRITIGRFGELTAEQARKEAVKLAGQIATGGDPVAEKAHKKLEGTTLRQAFETYMERRTLKPQTVFDIGRCMKEVYPDWLDKPMVRVTPDRVVKRHRDYGENHSEARANLAMRYLRAIFNFAQAEYATVDGKPIIEGNPVKKLSQTKSWHRVERRDTLINAHELGPWFLAVRAVENDTLRDYLTLMVLAGLRRQEAATLKWADVDLTGKTLTVRDPKNRRDHTIPLSDFLFDMLAARKAGAINDYVFPGGGAGGYIVEPRKQIAKVADACGITFTPHDLRRTFATVAESLDIPAYAIKALLNHKTGGDVTGGYIIVTPERLREPMQKITDYVLKAAGLKPTAAVVELKREARG